MTALLWSLAAWCALALAMPRHHEQVFGREGSARAHRGWRCSGAAALLIVLAHAVRAEGWSLGCLTWIGAMAVSGAASVLLLAWKPRWCLAMAGTAALLGTIATP